MDVLVDVLESLRLRGHLYFGTELTGAWGVALPADRSAIRFHLVVQGSCFVAVDDRDASVLLHEGDFALVPHGAAQRLSDAPGRKATPLDVLLDGGALGGDGVLRHGTGGARTRLICGFCSFDDSLSHPLFAGLAPLVAMGPSFAGSAPWLAETVRAITTESDLGAQGSSAVISRLVEVLFIQTIRQGRAFGEPPEHPFLRAVADEHLGRALAAMHESPERAWRLDELARVAAMSRSRFALRFKAAIGCSPLRYLAEWRLGRARRLLRETAWSVAEVAFRSGYRSQASFTRRFGQRFGVSPKAFRRGADGGETPSRNR